MQQINRYLGLLLLGATLVAPCAIQASSVQGQPFQTQKKQKQVFDKDHKDYHAWDDQEDHAYRAWLDGKHEKYRDYSKLNAKEQSEYWNYRHK